MSPGTHHCILPQKHTSGFSKLPPNTTWLKKQARNFRKLLAMNPNNFKSREFFRNKSTRTAEQQRYARSPYFYVIHPFSNLSSFLEVVFFIMWLSSIIFGPLQNFIDSLSVHKMLIVWLNLQRVVLLSFFFIGYVDTKTKEIVLIPKLIIWKYLRTYFIFDASATRLPQTIFKVLFEIMNGDLTMRGLARFNYISGIISICCYSIRMNTVLHFLKHIGKYIGVCEIIQILTVHILKTFLFLHIFTCFLYGVPDALYRPTYWPRESWLYQAGIHDESDSSMLQKYIECLLVTVCYFFGASHGAYEVTVPNEQLYLSIVTLFGRLYTLFLLADLLKVFGIARVSDSKYEQQLTSLEEYMVSKNLPANLRNRLLKFYEYKLQKHYFNEPEILSTLSEHLRTELFLFSARKLIRKVYVFKYLPKATLGAIIASMKMETYSPKDVIIKIGTDAHDIFFISSGTVAFFNKDGLELSHMEDGDGFGIVASLTDSKHKYQVEAVEATEVFCINRDDFLHLLDGHPEAIKTFQKSVQERVDYLSKREETMKRGGAGFMSELRAGTLLETRRRRPIVEE